MPVYRYAEAADIPLLAQLNLQLIRDEGHRNPMDEARLQNRMQDWLDSGEPGNGEYHAVLFEIDGNVAAYALYKLGSDSTYLRQFFVCRQFRRKGIGRQAINILRAEVWPPNVRIRVEVLAENHPAQKFWESVGFLTYSITLEA